MKINGIICYVKIITEKSCNIEVLCSDSVYRKFIVYGSNYDVGMQIFGVYYIKNNIDFLFVEDVRVNLGYFFWKEKENLRYLKEICKICHEKLPLNIHINFLYENFIKQIRLIENNDISLLKEFENWILN